MLNGETGIQEKQEADGQWFIRTSEGFAGESGVCHVGVGGGGGIDLWTPHFKQRLPGRWPLLSVTPGTTPTPPDTETKTTVLVLLRAAATWALRIKLCLQWTAARSNVPPSTRPQRQLHHYWWEIDKKREAITQHIHRHFDINYFIVYMSYSKTHRCVFVSPAHHRRQRCPSTYWTQI